jgi:hypothetical protein
VDQQARTIAKAEDLSTVRFQLAHTPGDDRIAANVGSFRGHEIAQDGIEERNRCRQKSATQ